jgi:hypothetical protein
MLVHATAANNFGFVGGVSNVNIELAVLRSNVHELSASNHPQCYKYQFQDSDKLVQYFRAVDLIH